MGLRQIFAANLARFRDAKGYSQERLAHEAELDRTYVSSLERCRYAASLDVVEKIARVFDVDPSELLQIPPRANDESD